ncbi:IucA/IucC family protein [Paenibacillus agilis]|uniref:IucA/IucC family siderophore biosynthesis protein n=1 Tax=Paenibacillus agilis TaxID=3020863 RepID=A0A559J1M7_9BACL|nr:IucA/IucC family protein [Paenibacillus agilis]TVX93751.1 IucA/IucC family siderophore biosynthesis protein [Paenibacillus agilis]
MNTTLTLSQSQTAVQRIMKDVMDAFLAEQFFQLDDRTTISLSAASNEWQQLFPMYEGTSVYVGNIVFLIEKCYKQGYQWVAGSPIYKNEDEKWVEISSPIKVAQMVLRHSLSEEAYAHPGVSEFLAGLDIAIQQLHTSLEQAGDALSFTPSSAYEWYVKGEMIASLRDRPFHPLSKAKIGFTTEDYQNYMAEFGKKTALHWVAIHNESVVNGYADAVDVDRVEPYDVLHDEQKAMIDQELDKKAISKEQYTIIPVHTWQLQHIILPNFKQEIEDKTIIVLDTQIGDFFATSSVRSLTSTTASTKMVKLPISVLSLGAARYLPVVKLLNGIVGEKMFRQALACDETLAHKVFLCEENNWWGYMPASMGLFDDHPRHLAAQVRIYPQQLLDDSYKFLPMSSLGVVLPAQHFLTEIAGGSISKEEVIQFYSELAATFYDIVMRLFKVGIVPEIHGQNCCVVLKDNKVSGLLFRDHDSVRLHQPYLDKHGIEDPRYHIRPGYSNSLYNETLEKLIFYVQSLGTQVNLASIIEALSESYQIPVSTFWEITEAKLKDALQIIDIPEADRDVLQYELFENKVWPAKLIIRPLLEADGVPGAMPSGKGIGFNPFYK